MISEQEEKEFNADVRRRQAERGRLEKRAAEGDVDLVWAELTRPRPAGFDPGELFPLLMRAIEVRARLSPEKFSGEVLAKLVSLTSYLALRSHYLIIKRIEQFDASTQGRGRVELPAAFTDKAIPQLLALQGSLAETLQAQASVARGWELAKGKRIENGREGRKPSAKAKARAKVAGKPKSKPTVTKAKAAKNPRAMAHASGKSNGNGKPTNRIADLLDGIGSKANGFHGDD